MSVLRFFAVAFIFCCVSVAWAVLGGSMWLRTESLDSELSGEMARLWGPTRVIQMAPYLADRPDAAHGDTGSLDPAASAIDVKIRHQDRDKGLLWYSTFTVDFDATYAVPAGPLRSPETVASNRYFVFKLPEGITSHDGLKVSVDDAPYAVTPSEKTSGHIAVPLERIHPHKVRVSFTTYGQDFWEYVPSEAVAQVRRAGDSPLPSVGRMSELKDFSLTIMTDFEDIDYPAGTRSPTRRAEATNGGMQAQWLYESLMTNQTMGIAMPKRPNAGPIARRMSLFAPVSLFFFFTVLFTVVVLKKIPLHPMHYLFVSAAFFAFHLLLAYLCDRISIYAAFWTCAMVSMVLVVTYMYLVAGARFGVFYVGAAQLVYLVGFSYAFLFPGSTGLTITILAILTLFVLMLATARVKWFEVFSRSKPLPPVPPVPTPAVTAPDAPGSQGT